LIVTELPQFQKNYTRKSWKSAPAPLPLDKAAPVLAMHVSRVQRRMGSVALQTGFAMALPLIAAWLAIEMPLDWHFTLPLWLRAFFLVAGLGGACAAGWRFGIRPWLNRPGDDQVALAIEHALPELRSRFIAAIQLSRRPEEHGQPLVRALVKETTEFTRELEFTQVVQTGSLRRWLKISLAACALGAGLWWLGGKASLPLLQRAFLSSIPKPCNTRITTFTGDRVIALGDDLRLEATAAEAVPVSGRLHIKTARGSAQEFILEADPARPSRFARTLQSVQESFTYWIELGDNRTVPANVRVRPRPSITSLALEQHWPPYTGIPVQPRMTSDLKLLAGSKLAVALRTSVPLRAAIAQLIGPDRAVRQSAALELESQPTSSGPEWRGVIQIPSKNITGLTFQLADEEGVESKGMAVYRVDVIPDEPPSLAILWPQRREELVTPRATLLVAFETKDDFGLSRVKLHYAVNWTEGGAHRSVDLDLGSSSPKSLTRRFEWDLSRLNPPLLPGDVVDYWLEAADANNVTGPGVTALPQHYQARVVSDEEKRADLAARLGDTLQGLNDVRLGQEELARRLGEIIYEKKP
jgi:hypothetical protein